MGPSSSQLNNTNIDNMYIYILNPLNSSTPIIRGNTNFQYGTNMYIWDLYISDNIKCIGDNNNSTMVYIAILQSVQHQNCLMVASIDLNTGSMINIIMKITNKTLLSTYNLPEKTAFSNEYCYVDILRGNKKLQTVLIHIDLINGDYVSIEDKSSKHIMYDIATIWYSNIDGTNDKLLTMFAGESGELSSIREVIINRNNGSNTIQYETICNIVNCGVYDVGKSPFAYYDNYLFYLGQDYSGYLIAFTLEITNNNNSVCINGKKTESTSIVNSLWGMTIPYTFNDRTQK